MLRVLRLPSFMICTILLSILFFYDIFFVFITPLVTSVSVLCLYAKLLAKRLLVLGSFGQPMF